MLQFQLLELRNTDKQHIHLSAQMDNSSGRTFVLKGSMKDDVKTSCPAPDIPPQTSPADSV